MLGLMYLEGKEVPQDYNKARAWFEKAANQGDSFAQFRLAFMYLNGEGAPRDYKQAKDWFCKACDNGNQGGCEAIQHVNESCF